MKRHEALAPLSREHHESLILAQLLKINAPVYDGLPVLLNEKIEYALAVYNDHIKDHFKREEAILDKLNGLNEELDWLIAEIKEEHKTVTGYFNSMDAVIPDIELMNSTGVALEIHIRKEERLLFPLIQRICNEAMFREIENILS
ncbi:MAG: hemerythrin domain-containing protein [Bacteroidetes bacterium]|nr:hemerythrin domain-containing protein [Bacteroidota bacterium]